MSKARVLLNSGYHVTHWQEMQSDIRRFHLYADVEVARQSLYGTRDDTRTPVGHSGRAFSQI